jgi:hypothetical protein
LAVASACPSNDSTRLTNPLTKSSSSVSGTARLIQPYFLRGVRVEVVPAEHYLDRPRPPAARDRLSPPPATLTARLEQAFAARLDSLSDQVRLMLLAAALDAGASLTEVAGVASRLHGQPTELAQLDAAVDADLVEIVDAELRFRHPLKRSAVRQAAPPAQVLAMHRALAEVVADPERQLWQRAMAAVGCDEELAAALDAHAAVARRRGAVAVAATALERAAALTPEPVRKGERLVRAAEVAYELGLVEIVRRLLQQVEAVEIGPPEAARSAWLQHMISGDVWVRRGGTCSTRPRALAYRRMIRCFSPS